MHGSIWDFVGACVWTPAAIWQWVSLLFDDFSNVSSEAAFMGILLTLATTAGAAWSLARVFGLY